MSEWGLILRAGISVLKWASSILGFSLHLKPLSSIFS